MKYQTSITLAVLLTLGVATTATAQSSEVVTASAEIVEAAPLSLSVVQSIEFGRLLRPSAPGTICSYFLSPRGGFNRTFFDGTNETRDFAGCIFEAQQGQAAIVELACQESANVEIAVDYQSAGLTDLIFDDTRSTALSLGYPVAVNDVGGDFPINPIRVCEATPLAITIGGRVQVGPNAPLGAATVGTVTVSASYE